MPTDICSLAQDIVFVWLIRDDCYGPLPPAPCRYGRDEFVLRVMQRMHRQEDAAIMQDAIMAHFLRSSCGACGCPAMRKNVK